MRSNTHKFRNFYEPIIAVLLAVLLIFIFFSLDPSAKSNTWPDLIRSLIPNILAVIIVFIVLYTYRNRLASFVRDIDQTSLSGRSTLISSASTSQSINGFINGLDQTRILKFHIIAITGEVTVRSFLNAIERSSLKNSEIECQILLRSQFATDKRRGDAIERTISNLESFRTRYPKFKFEVRTYSASLPFHAVICEHGEEKFSGLLSFYDWTDLNWRESASKDAFIRNHVDKHDPLLGLYISWFYHLWGTHKIHTVLFDFDDTLFITTHAQVKAWIDAIEIGIEKKFVSYDDLNEELKETFETKNNLMDVMTDIFLDEQEEEKIARRIFRRDLSRDLTNDMIERLRPLRIRRREELTKADAIPILSVISDLRELNPGYQLVIVSATAESLIEHVLRANNLAIFSYVLGREAPRQTWQLVENKAQHFIRVSNILGVPLERMVFVGDSDADFRAARQLGIQFIEVRFNATKYSRESLIGRSRKVTHSISGSVSGELISEIRKIEAEVASIPSRAR